MRFSKLPQHDTEADEPAHPEHARHCNPYAGQALDERPPPRDPNVALPTDQVPHRGPSAW
jgi:hypothetical protein